MSDYDAKSIPILDDIIEIDVSENVKGRHLSDPENESPDTEDDLDLFSKEAVVPIAETDEPQIGEIDELADEQAVIYQPAPDVTQATEPGETEIADISSFAYQAETEYMAEPAEEAESALPDYQQEQTSSAIESAVSINSDGYNDVDTPLVENEPSTTQPLILETIVEDVVKQLMPDLEQQLRYLVQQALEDRLPDELIGQLPPDEDNV